MYHHVLPLEVRLKCADIQSRYGLIALKREGGSLASCLTCQYCGGDNSYEIPSIARTVGTSARGDDVGIILSRKAPERYLEEVIPMLKIVDSAYRIVKVTVCITNGQRVICLKMCGSSELRHTGCCDYLTGVSVGCLELFENNKMVPHYVVGYFLGIKTRPARYIARLSVTEQIDAAARNPGKGAADVSALDGLLDEVLKDVSNK